MAGPAGPFSGYPFVGLFHYSSHRLLFLSPRGSAGCGPQLEKAGQSGFSYQRCRSVFCFRHPYLHHCYTQVRILLRVGSFEQLAEPKVSVKLYLGRAGGQLPALELLEYRAWCGAYKNKPAMGSTCTVCDELYAGMPGHYSAGYLCFWLQSGAQPVPAYQAVC